MDLATSTLNVVTADTNALRINGARLWQSIMDLAQIGGTAKGGVCRLALTDLDRQGRDLFSQWARDAGCTIRVDAIGNIFARRAGTDNSLAPVMTGSHIDTQPTGGKFDGNYGVLAGIEVLRTLNDAGIRTRAPLEVAVWTNEEGSRFVPVMMGSGVFVGAFSLEHALNAKDQEGISVCDALQKIGYAGDAGTVHPIGAYFEAHIEQGPVLENNEKVIGVVQAALGQRLAAYAGKPVGVVVRTAQEMAAVLAGNPFPDTLGNRTVAIFLDSAPPADTVAQLKGQNDELVQLGLREIYVAYGSGMGSSKFKIPAAANGTARNMNTVAKLVEMAGAL